MKFVKRLIQSPFFWILLILIGAGVVLLAKLSEPSKATITTDIDSRKLQSMEKQAASRQQKDLLNNLYQNSKYNDQVQQAGGVKQFTGTYFGLTYPYGYSIKEHDLNQGTTVESIYLSQPSAASQKITVAIDTENSGSIDKVSHVVLRRSQKDVYKESPVMMLGIQGVSFEKTTDGYEKDIFLLSKGRLTYFVFTSGGPDLAGDFSRILTSFHYTGK